MNFKDRLRQLDGGETRYKKHVQKKIDHDALAVLNGTTIKNDLGSFIRVQQKIRLDGQHGVIGLAEANKLSSKLIATASKNKVSAEFDISRALFIDTETTGLSGGTGTYAFLIGIGFLEKDQLVVEQLFMDNLNGEPALLTYLNELIKSHRGIVSFNGKSFDIPLLVTRFVRHRMNPVIDLHEHFDLLHASRRLWQNDFGSCSLGTLEENVLGFRRIDDIPGKEIPNIYREFLQSGLTGKLPQVMLHNKFDIISLLALVIWITRWLDRDRLEMYSTSEALRLAKLYEATNALHKAAGLFGSLISRTGLSKVEKTDARLRLAQLHKKQKSYAEAVHIWQDIVENYSGNADAFIELAKYFEHRERNFKAAMEYTRRCLNLVETRLALRQKKDLILLKEQLIHRMNRLNKKCNQ